MKPKSLIPLAIILVVLAGLVVMKKQQHKTPDLVQQVGLVKLLPDGLSKSDVAKLELYAGSKADQKIVLAYDKDGDRWRVTSHFNSPAKKDVVEKYVDAILGLKGEPRATNASDADLESYSLVDGKAFHVVGYKKDDANASFHFLVGKAPGYNSVFIRKADGKDVFVEQTDLRRQAGIYANEKEKDSDQKAPESGMWLDKDVVKIDTGKATKLALTTPDKSLVFERREKPKAEEAAKPADPAKPEEKKADAPKEYEWVAVSGAGDLKLKPKSVENLIQKLTPLTATDIVDPAKKGEYGLETPAYKCVVSVEGQGDVTLEGGRPNMTADGYMRLAGAKEDLVFSVSKYSFEGLFARGSDLFELPTPAIDKTALTAIDLTQPEWRLSLTKGADNKWSIAAPASDLMPQATALDGVATALTNWKPSDFADAAAIQGEPTRTATFQVAGQPHSLKLFNDAKSSDGVYARLDDAPAVLVMGRADISRIFVAPKDVYQKKLMDLVEDDVTSIAVKSPKSTFTIAREGEDKWTLDVAGAKSEAKGEACTTLAADIVGLQADNILFGKAAPAAPAESTIEVTMKDKSVHTLSFTAEMAGQHELTLSGKPTVFAVQHGTIANLFPAPDTLKEAPAPAPAAPGVPAAAPAAPSPEGGIQVLPAPAPEKPQLSVTPAPAPAPVTIPATPAVPAVPAAPAEKPAEKPAEAAPVSAAPVATPAPTPAPPAPAAPAPEAAPAAK